jgi:hypothetical protein
MKKLVLFAVVAFASSAAFSQMAVSGGDFANHPERYDNKPVTLKQVTVGESHHGPGGHEGPGGHHAAPHGAPGMNDHGAPCTPPTGTKQIPVNFTQNPGYKGCFYAKGPMATQILNQARGPQPVEMVLSIKGNQKMGYLITAHKIGH